MINPTFFFRYLKGRCHGNQFRGKITYPTLHLSLASVIQKWNGITPVYAWLNSATNATISCKILVKIGPVVLAENILIEIALRVHVVVRRILSNISEFTVRFSHTFHHVKALYVPMTDQYLIFQFAKGTLPWKPNNFSVMKANWYYCTCILCTFTW